MTVGKLLHFIHELEPLLGLFDVLDVGFLLGDGGFDESF